MILQLESTQTIINPNYVAQAYINRGSAKRALGDHAGGKQDMDKAVDLAKALKGSEGSDTTD